jgi:hypothetical protein
MIVACPYCQIPIDCSGHSGVIHCPRCGRGFQSPEQSVPIVSSYRHSAPVRRKPDNTLLIFGGAIAGVVLVAAAFLLIDELRFWNAKRHVKEEIKEIDRQFRKADRDIKKASDDFERAIRQIPGD